MKDYEIFTELKIPKGFETVLRLDGRSFHNLSKILEFKKPYDSDFAKLMVQVSKDLFKEFSPSLIYTFSDEINILLSQIPFSARVEKIDSNFASFAAGSFTKHLYESKKFKKLPKPVSFDSRIIALPKELVSNYFKFRQKEAWGNCINSYSYWTLREDLNKEEANKKIKGLKSPQMHDLLFSKGININDIPTWHKRGIAIYRKEENVKGFNPIKGKVQSSKRTKIYVDCNLDLFDSDYFKW